MKVSQTSLQAYADVKNHLGPMQQLVFDIICEHPGVCDREIRQIAENSLDRCVGINSITPRRNELLKSGFICNGDIKLYPDDAGRMREVSSYYPTV